MVLNGNSHIGIYRYKIVGTIEASSLEIANDFVYKKFRREVNKKNGETYILIPDSGKMNVNSHIILPLDSVPNSIIKYLEP
jgi:hypothetical protein